jgi:hypothetical protein
LPRSRHSRRPTAPRGVLENVQPTCDADRGKACRRRRQRIRADRIDEFTQFGGHQIDANGRLFHFGLTEAEHEEDDGGDRPASVGQLGWWQVMKILAALFGNDTPTARGAGYRDASTSTQGDPDRGVLRSRRPAAARREARADPETREVLARGGACAPPSSTRRGRRPSSAM